MTYPPYKQPKPLGSRVKPEKVHRKRTLYLNGQALTDMVDKEGSVSFVVDTNLDTTQRRVECDVQTVREAHVCNTIRHVRPRADSELTTDGELLDSSAGESKAKCVLIEAHSPATVCRVVTPVLACIQRSIADLNFKLPDSKLAGTRRTLIGLRCPPVQQQQQEQSQR